MPSRFPRRRRSDVAKVPPLSLVLGYGPMAVLPLLAVTSAALPPELSFNCLVAGKLWGAGVLMFMGGVRRGLSFGAPEGRERRQAATAIAYFLIGIVATAATFGVAFGLLMMGYALAGVLDRRAARASEAPPYFAQLRPLQAAVALLGFAGLLVEFLLLS